MKNRFSYLLIFLFGFLFLSRYVEGAIISNKSEIKVHFSECPKKPASDFVFKTSKIFESKNKSLKEVKKFISENRLKTKHFLSDYQINYNPVKKVLNYHLNCSPPLLKVSALDEKGNIAYDIVLTEDGETHDPSYLVYLSSEKKKEQVPKAALPVNLLTGANKKELVILATEVLKLNKISLREMIYTEKGEMTMIVGKNKKIISVFLGESFWEKKLGKLDKIITYMEAKRKLPSQINLTDINKVVIKF